MTFPKKLRQLRERSGLSVADLAEKAGLSRAMVHALESGARKPSLETAQALCKVLKVSLAEFDKSGI